MPDVRGWLGNDVIRLPALRSFCRARRSGPRVTSTVCTYVKLDPAPRSLSFSPCFLPGFPSRSCVPAAFPLPLFSSFFLLSLSPSSTSPYLSLSLFRSTLARFLFLFFPPSGVHSRKIPRLVIRRSFSSLSLSLLFSLFVRPSLSLRGARASGKQSPTRWRDSIKPGHVAAIATMIRFYCSTHPRVDYLEK